MKLQCDKKIPNYSDDTIQAILKNTILSSAPDNIIICKDNDNIDLFSKYNLYKIYNVKELIYAKIFNPPFFKLIILNNTMNTKDINVMTLYNNVLMNGTLIISKKYFNLFKSLNNPIKTYKDYIIIHKKNNKIFNIKNGG